MARIGVAIKIVALTAFAGLFGGAYADSPIVIDGVGHAIGYYMNNNCPRPGVMVMSRQSYVACLKESGALAMIDVAVYLPLSGDSASGSNYQSNDCTGQRYAWVGPGATGGFVIETLQGLMVGPLSATNQTVVVASSDDTYNGSVSGFATCTALTPSAQTGIPIFPLATIQTGFNPAPYVAPLAVRVLPDSVLSDEIFFDTFEGSY